LSRRYRPAAHDDAFSWPSGLDDGDDDGWADRLWADMRRRQREADAAARREAGLLRDAAAARAGADAERRRRAEAAAAESARILAEERAKQANWRDAMLRQVAEVGLEGRRGVWVCHEGTGLGRSSCLQPLVQKVPSSSEGLLLDPVPSTATRPAAVPHSIPHHAGWPAGAPP
jgi:hypothetical protein